MTYKLFTITNCNLDISRITLSDKQKNIGCGVLVLKKLDLINDEKFIQYKTEIDNSIYNGANVHIIKNLIMSYVDIDMIIAETLLNDDDDTNKQYSTTKNKYFYKTKLNININTLIKFFNKIKTELNNNECTIASFYNDLCSYDESVKNPVYNRWISHTVILHKNNSILYLYDPQLNVNINVETNIDDLKWLETRILVKTIYYKSNSIKYVPFDKQSPKLIQPTFNLKKKIQLKNLKKCIKLLKLKTCIINEFNNIMEQS